MSNLSRWSLASAAFLGLGVSAGTSFLMCVPALTQTTFSDVEPSYWAQPFIEGLVAQDIISGYPDGTFRPEQPIERDEFAALIRDAFNQNEVRQIPSGSVFKDVPKGYWAASAIEEAYEAGFMRGFSGGLFKPKEEVSRVQALISLVNVLDLPPASPAASKNQTSARQATKKPVFFPLAITSLMQPLVMVSANNKRLSNSSTTSSVANNKSVSLSRPKSSIVSDYYIDAEKVPSDAVDDVAAATKANIVVNYPNPKVLNPSQPLTRGIAAALIYQTLVYQGKLSPLRSSVEASNYIVDPAAK